MNGMKKSNLQNDSLLLIRKAESLEKKEKETLGKLMLQ